MNNKIKENKTEKICSKCNILKSITEFYSGRNECKDCDKKYKEQNKEKIKKQKVEYYEQNKEHILDRSKKHYNKNIKIIKKRNKKYREENKEKIQKYHQELRIKKGDELNQKKRESYQKNKKKINNKRKEQRKNNLEARRQYEKAYREKYYKIPKNREQRRKKEKERENKNKDKILRKKRERNKIRRKIDVEYKISTSLRNSLYTSIIQEFKQSSAIKLLGCSIQEFKIFIEAKWIKGMTWKNWGKGKDNWNLDHILPIELFNLKNFEEQQICFHYTNFQPLWESENEKKSDLLPDGRRARNLTSENKLEYLKSVGITFSSYSI